MPQHKCMRCSREAVKIPVMVIPIIDYSIPAYMMLREGLCENHIASFTMKDYTDYDGSWYDLIRAELAQREKEVPDWSTGRIIDQDKVTGLPIIDESSCRMILAKGCFVPVPKEECHLEMWDIQTLYCKMARMKLFREE